MQLANLILQETRNLKKFNLTLNAHCIRKESSQINDLTSNDHFTMVYLVWKGYSFKRMVFWNNWTAISKKRENLNP